MYEPIMSVRESFFFQRVTALRSADESFITIAETVMMKNEEFFFLTSVRCLSHHTRAHTHAQNGQPTIHSDSVPLMKSRVCFLDSASILSAAASSASPQVRSQLSAELVYACCVC